MESPTPETGTPESQSPARTPPALITTEELLQSMTKSPEAAACSPFESSPRGSVSHRAAAERYELLRAADAGHRLRGLRLPPEAELRAAALGGLPTVGPPPWLPHQLSPALQSVLAGWRSVYESCRTAPVLQALVGDCYAHDAVFEDALVSARGQEALYRQFAMLGAAVRAVQVAAYSLSVTPLPHPVVRLELQPPACAPPGASPAEEEAAAAAQDRAAAAAAAAAAALRAGQAPPLQPPAPSGPQATRDGRPPPPALPLHLTRVTVENVQCLQLGMPQWLAWLVGGKGAGPQIHLYVTSILLVASDAPLAADGWAGSGGAAVVRGPGLGGFGGAFGSAGAWTSDPTATRLAGAAEALGRAALGGRGGGGGGGGPPAGPSAASGAVGGGGGGSLRCSWRIVHQIDIWHNVPLVWWRLRRALCVAVDALLAPLLRL